MAAHESHHLLQYDRYTEAVGGLDVGSIVARTATREPRAPGGGGVSAEPLVAFA